MRQKALCWGIMLLFTAGIVAGCATTQGYQAGALGAAGGALAGGLIGGWRGAVIGGALGAALFGTLGEISGQAAQEAAQRGRVVRYYSDDGAREIEAIPTSYNPRTRCTKVRERIFEHGRLVKDTEREVCESAKTERSY